jgi:methyl-accepting chemotaxis protein
MTIASFSGTRFVRAMVLRFKNSEEEAIKKSEDLKKMVEQTRFTIDELNSIVGNINHIVDESLKLSTEQLHYSESSIGIVSHFSKSINSIASMARAQDENCQENAKSISSLNDVTNKIDNASLNIKEKGNKSITLAEKGERELNQSIQEIKNIAVASTDVSKIVALINTIASQTNLLSLNAAIEAARAGEEGKGFEIVANEVSKLADSSGRNAKQIAGLIIGMKNTVEKGENQIRNSSTSMKEIMQMIFNISHDVQDINEIVHEQIDIIQESRIRTDVIQDMAQKMKLLTNEEENNSTKLKTDIEKVFSASKEVAERIHHLHENAEKLKKLSDKLQLEG